MKIETRNFKPKFRAITSAVCLFLFSNSAFGLGWFSRACEFSATITAPTGPFSPPSSFVLFSSCQPYVAGCWALESVTAEYGTRTVWLHAVAQTYSRAATDLVFSAERVFSSGWKVDPSEKDSTFGESGYLFRARAGTGSPTAFFVQLDPTRRYATVGVHKTFNPRLTETLEVARTVAYDCNVLQLGIYNGAWYDGPIPPPVR
jgi:hypothetical protein